MNYYAMIPLIAFLVNFFTWIYIFAQKRKSSVNRAYLILAAFFAVWSMESFLIWSSSNEKWLLPLLKATQNTGFIVAFCYLNFTYIFLERKRDQSYYFFVVCGIVASLINLLTNLHVGGYVKYSWGAGLSAGTLYVPITVMAVVLPLIYGIFITYKRMKEESDVNIKHQLLLICEGSFIGTIIGFISDIILPFILSINVPRVAISSSAIMSIFVFMAVYKYNFLSISVEEAASYLFTNVKDSVVLFDRNGRIIQANHAAIELLNLTLPEKSQKIFQLLDGYNFREDYKDYETRIIINNDEKAVSISQAMVKNGDVELGKILIVRDVTESKKAEKELKDSKAKLERLAGELVQANTSLEQKVIERTKSLLMSNEQLLREIAERKRAEEALATEKERLAVTLGSIGDGVITTDTAGHIVLLNRVAEQLTGWSQSEAVGQPLVTVFRIVDEKTRVPCENPVEEALHTNEVISSIHHTILRAKDAVEHIVAKSAAPIRTQDGKVIGVVLVFRDMTERRRIEEELVKADKLESIGMLAGGIAHDFNNILMAIIGNISLAKMYANPEDDKVYTRLINGEKAVLQAQNLTQQLLTFSKGGSLVRKPSSIVELTKDAIDFSLRGSNVRCELFTEDNIYPVEVDEGQIGQVINNLIINADQAMPDGGVIEVHINNVTVESGNTDPLLPLQKGQYVKIAVKDQGVGIPEEDLPKIFDPYFTTKKKGSGLGLFTCYSIIKKHDGHIAVESHRGTGTTFYVYIPASHRQVHKPESQTSVHPAGHGRILVMEDEETIRDVTGEMLRHFGYEVAFAREGAEAIELYKRAMDTGQPFDVLIMDLTIPGGMGGKEAVRKILDIDPQAKAVVATGYANDPIIAEFRQYGFCDRIAKPYKSEELHGILHRVITGVSA